MSIIRSHILHDQRTSHTLVTRKELLQIKKDVVVPEIKVEQEDAKIERDETLWRMFHPDSTPAQPINAEFDWNGYHVKIENGMALIPQWLVSDFKGMGYILGAKDGIETFGYTC